MKGTKCEDCVYYDELKTEQPCCGCVDFVNFECDHQTEKGGEGVMAEIKLNKRYKYAGDIFPKLIDIGFDIGTATDFLNNIKDADVVEVKYGYWEIVKGSNGKEKMVCTNCRHQQDLHSTFTYCPNCGALIDGRLIHNG